MAKLIEQRYGKAQVRVPKILRTSSGGSDAQLGNLGPPNKLVLDASEERVNKRQPNSVFIPIFNLVNYFAKC